MSSASAAAHRASLRTALMALLAMLAAMVAIPERAVASVVLEMKVRSVALGRPLDVSVYRPDGPAPAAGWPVLYLLHGLNGNYRDWSNLGGVQKTLDRLIEAHRIKPMLVVMPDGGNSWYVDSAAVGGPGNYETAILADLPEAIEGAFPVQRAREGRAIAGLSMGGYGALRLALTRPDRYVAAASLSGAIWQNEPIDFGRKPPDPYFQRVDAATVVSGVDLPPAGDHFGGAFGSPFSPKRFNAQNVFTLLADRLREGVPLPAMYLTVGDHDCHNLLRGSVAFYETLTADGVDVDLRVTAGDHVWALWRKSIEDALLFVDSKFADSKTTAKTDGAATAPKLAGGEAIVR